jgi:hypothetical protein
MKYLKFNENFAPQLGMEYAAQTYPESGIYHTSAGYIIVNKESMLAMNLGMNITLTEYIEPTQAQSNMTEAFVLKALAVAQNPSLIKEIV